MVGKFTVNIGMVRNLNNWETINGCRLETVLRVVFDSRFIKDKLKSISKR